MTRLVHDPRSTIREAPIDGRPKGGGDGLLLVALIALSILLDRMQTGAGRSGRLDVVGNALRRTVGWVGRPLGALFESTGDFSRRLREGDRLARENEALRARLNAVGLYAEQIDALNDQVQNLRGLSGLGPLPGHERVMADVVGFHQYEGRIDLSVGSERGVQPDMPVISADGLVAIVQTVWPGGSQAALITNVGVSVGGLDLSRKPPAAGILKGRDPSTLVLTFLDPNASAASGDTVVTSGYGPRIPRLLRVGRIVSVENDVEYGIRRALVVPFMAPGTLKEVQVLK